MMDVIAEYVVFSTSFSFPQLLPARALMMLMRFITLSLMFFAWCWKENIGSKVTPRIFGSWMMGMLLPAMWIGSYNLTLSGGGGILDM